MIDITNQLRLAKTNEEYWDDEVMSDIVSKLTSIIPSLRPDVSDGCEYLGNGKWHFLRSPGWVTLLAGEGLSTYIVGHLRKNFPFILLPVELKEKTSDMAVPERDKMLIIWIKDYSAVEYSMERRAFLEIFPGEANWCPTGWPSEEGFSPDGFRIMDLMFFTV